MCSESQTMKQQAHEISSGLYTYKHRCEGGVDVHDVFVNKSAFRVLLAYIGAIFLLCICFSCPVVKVSLVFMPAFGVQLEEHFRSGRVHRKFLPIDKILEPVLNECVTPVTCYWSLALILLR